MRAETHDSCNVMPAQAADDVPHGKEKIKMAVAEAAPE
jgi:hypothetical protein